MQCSLNKDHQHLKWQLQKSRTSYQGFQDVQDRQLMQYPLIIRSKWKMHQRYLKFSKSECPDIWIRLPKHKWPKSWSSTEDPVVSLERNLYGRPLAGLLWERQFEKVLLEHCWKKFSTVNVLLSTEQEDYSYQCRWLTSKWQEKQKTWDRLGKIYERRWFGKNQPPSWTTKIWLHSKRMYNKQWDGDKIQRYVWSQDFCWSQGKNYLQKLQGNLMQKYLLGPTTWKVMQRNVVKDMAN